MTLERLIEAMKDCGWYNGLRPQLEELIAHIESNSSNRYVECPDNINFDDADIMPASYAWMLCVLMFGNYGTSPRYGWIEHPNEAISFLKSILPDEEEEN